MSRAVLDERWHRDLSEIFIADDNWINNFCTVPEDERQRFFENEVENPRFMLCASDVMQLDVYESALTGLMVAINTEEKNEHVAALYITKIERQLGLVPMFRASEAKEDREFYAHAAAHYGKPQKQYFYYIAKRIKDLLKSESESPHVDSLRALSRVFSKIDTTKVDISNDVLPGLNIEIDDSPVITADDAAGIFSDTMIRLGIDDWEIVLDTTGRRRYVSVNSQKRRVYIPGDDMLVQRRKPFTRQRATALAEHEIGVHAFRQHNGMLSPLKLLEIGLAEYIRGEEGLAGYVQQQLEGTDEYYGFDRYLALSLAIGLDGHPRDFRSVYDIVAHYYRLTIAPHDKHEHLVRQAAWTACVRCFRGTTGLTAGAVYTKDIVYLEGNVGIWNLLIEKPNVFERLFVGKFDPLNDEHVKRLDALGIIEQY